MNIYRYYTSFFVIIIIYAFISTFRSNDISTTANVVLTEGRAAARSIGGERCIRSSPSVGEDNTPPLRAVMGYGAHLLSAVPDECNNSDTDGHILLNLSRYETYLLYLQVVNRLHIISHMALVQRPFHAAYVLGPDNLEQRTEGYKKRLVGNDYKNANLRYPTWQNGNLMRGYFRAFPGLYYITDLNDNEFDLFMTDPFSSHKKRFEYSFSPHSYENWGEPFCDSIILLSVGPNGVPDLDISQFDQAEAYWGLGGNFINHIYDPTNGIMSHGDIVSPPDIVHCYFHANSNQQLGPLECDCKLKEP